MPDQTLRTLRIGRLEYIAKFILYSNVFDDGCLPGMHFLFFVMGVVPGAWIEFITQRGMLSIENYILFGRGWPFCADKRAQKPPKGETSFALWKPTSTRGLLRIVQEFRLSRSYAAGIKGLEPKL